MSDFDKELAQFGILAKNGKQDIKDNKITIIDAEIKEIKFQKLQEKAIKEIRISGSEIKYLYFLEKNTIKIDFKVCNFKNQIIARESYFENEVIFHQCVFDAVVDFSKAEFNSKIDFLASVFKGEVRFIETQFQAGQSNNETIENDFGEVIFEGRVSFFNATFKARVGFGLSQFKSEANFIKTEFQANQNDSDIIENQFSGVIFAGKTIFNHATFKARVGFGLSQFKEEVRFIETQFQAEQSNNEAIENDFREVIFEGRVSFFNATFKARVGFGLSQFKSEANFIKTEFQANQNDSDIIENQFLGVVFIGRAFFSNATFKARVDFRLSQFKDEVRFIKAQFLAEQNNSKIIENDFREVIFEGRVFFFNATFKARVDFRLSQFKDEVRFIKAQFLAEQNNSKIIENEFREVIFEGRASFFNATFKARVGFRLSQFKSEAIFANTKFQANQNDSNIIEKQDDNEIIENEFREVIFEGRASFSNATFKARVGFILSQFKSEANFIKTEFQANQNDSDIIENQFSGVVFIGKTFFNHATFKARVGFGLSQFKDEVRFIKAQFLAEQNNSKIIENEFREVIFEGRASFFNATFKARVGFRLSQFKSEAIFANTKFQANQNDSDIIENQFLGVVFIGKTFFNHATFKARVSFGLSQFKDEVRFIKAQFLAEQNNSKIIENEFREVIFKGRAFFSNATFKARVDFRLSQFKDEVRFIKAQFLAEQNNSKIIENDFREVIFEGRASFFNATFKARVGFRLSQFKSEAIFANTKFQANQNDSDIIENQFSGVVFIGKTFFNHATFKARVGFGLSQFKDEVRFIKAQFLAEQNNSKIIENDFRETIFKGKVTFDSLVLKARISFLFSTFKDEILFLNINPNNCIFHNVEFNKINFIHNDDINVESNVESYVFQNAVFKDTLSFEGMKIERLGFDNVLFNGVVTFSNTKLNTKPQFINCTFSNQFNIEHQYIKYSDKDIENKINNIQDKNDKFRALLNLRDLFRKLKSNRIAHHNLIDASELRTQELYARELELKYQENKSLREKIEQWQLFFYRKLCDHHTDLLLNLKWLVVLIGSFALLYFTSCVIQDINLLKVLNQYGVCLSIIGVFSLFCLYWFECIKKFDFFVYLNLIVVLWVVCYKPKIIFGIVNIISGKSYNGFENVLITIYTILLALVLFSLQKTARKNSIVPS